MENRLSRNEVAQAVEYAFRYYQQTFGEETALSVAEVGADFFNLAAKSRPLSGGDETAVVSILQPKTAALVADRVWIQYAGEDRRLDFAFGWESPIAIRLGALIAF